MAKSETSAPRGTNKVIKAFFETLDATPDAGRAQVAKAALAAIRERLMARKDKEKAVREKAKAKSARGKIAPAPQQAVSPARTANARKTQAATNEPTRATKATKTTAPKTTQRPATRRAETADASAAPQPKKAAMRRTDARKKPAPEAAPLGSNTAQDGGSANGGPPDGTASAE